MQTAPCMVVRIVTLAIVCTLAHESCSSLGYHEYMHASQEKLGSGNIIAWDQRKLSVFSLYFTKCKTRTSLRKLEDRISSELFLYSEKVAMTSNELQLP